MVSGAVDQEVRLGMSIGRRMCLASAWTVFGLVFFYLVMVMLSALQKGIILDPLPRNGWARTACRHTGAAAVAPFALFLASDKRKSGSLFYAVMTGCALFAHMVILTSDLRVYSEGEVMEQLLGRERTHPVGRVVGVEVGGWIWKGVGSVGFAASVLLGMERTYGSGLGQGREGLGLVGSVATWVLVVCNVTSYVEMLIKAVVVDRGEDWREICYAVFWLVLLAACGTYRMASRAAEQAEREGDKEREKKRQ